MATKKYTLKKDELPMDVPMTECDQIAETYVGYLTAIDDAKKAIKDTEADLIAAMEAAGRVGITLKGRTITIMKSPEKVKISVRKIS